MRPQKLPIVDFCMHNPVLLVNQPITDYFVNVFPRVRTVRRIALARLLLELKGLHNFVWLTLREGLHGLAEEWSPQVVVWRLGCQSFLLLCLCLQSRAIPVGPLQLTVVNLSRDMTVLYVLEHVSAAFINIFVRFSPVCPEEAIRI